MVVRRKLRTPFFSMVAAPAIGTLVARLLAVFHHRRRAMTPFRRLSNFFTAAAPASGCNAEKQKHP
jgi:hypothetical protein